VLRDGKVVAELARGEASDADLVKLMVDRTVERSVINLPPHGLRTVASARGLATAKVRDLSFELRSGEILGFAGLIGSGMHEAALALCGASRITAGILELQGKRCRFKSPFEAARAGVVLVPEERKTQAIIPDLSVHENLHLGRTHLHRKGPLVDLRRMRKASTELIQRFGIRTRVLNQPIKTLSGGNQQKVILARCVQSSPALLILSEPTRGVDVAAKREIHRIILDLAAAGTAIVVVSSELEELLLLSHRIAVFSEGRMVQVLEGAEATPVAIMALATPERGTALSHHHAA
jgi:ABC-type sugar transport system ATPase subunit